MMASQPTHGLFRSLSILVCLLIVSCSTSPKSPDWVMDQTWEHVAWATKAIPVDERTIRVESLRSFGRSVALMEYDAIARAAAEAKRAGADHFIITYADYRRGALAFGPEFSSVRKVRIGSYPQLLAVRKEQEADMGPLGASELVLVVEFLDEKSSRYQRSFATDEVYEAMFLRRAQVNERVRPR